MGVIYRAYRDEIFGYTALFTVESEAKERSQGLLSPNAEFLWSIEADTLEEASAIYNLRMGFEPYVPMGDPAQCPKCGAWFYPEGSGECWRCGRIC